MHTWRMAVLGGLMLALPAVATAQVQGGRTGIGAKTGAQTFNVRGHLKRLKGDDSGLALYDLGDFNHTGIRLFIPATIGLHVRF